jgi:uncharacterized paraquat-inducible protein A
MFCFIRRCHDCNFPLGNKDLFCPRCGVKQRREKLAITVPLLFRLP